MDAVLVEPTRKGQTFYGGRSLEEELFYSLRLKGEDSIKRLECVLDKGLDLDRCYKGWTFLTAACYLGRHDIVDFIIRHYKQKNETPNEEKTTCGFNRNKSKLKLNIYNDQGDTPLISAARSGHLEVCHLLIENGVNINLPNQISSQTALLVAIECCHDDVVLYLLENDADIQITDNVGITPLYLAIKSGKEFMVNQLINHGCDVDIGSQDHSPIFLATRLGSLNMIQILCEAGCHMDIANKYGVTPVYEATLKGHIEVLQYLLDQECSASSVDMYGQSPLHIAALYGRQDAAKLLVEAGSNWKLRNQQGQTAMSIAIEKGYSQIVEYFLKEGIPVLHRNSGNKGLSSIVAVFERGHVSTMEVLIRGCARLPIPQCVGVMDMFRTNTYLFKLLLLSGIQTIPGRLLNTESSWNEEKPDWLTEFLHNPKSLKEICRIRIRRCLGNKVLSSTEQLLLPRKLQHYVTMDIL